MTDITKHLEAVAAIQRMACNKLNDQKAISEARLDEKQRIFELDHPTEAEIAWVQVNFGFAHGGIIHDFRPHGRSPLRIKDEASFGPSITVDPKEKFIDPSYDIGAQQPGPFDDPETKETNPKDAIGSRKAGLSTLSIPVLFEMGLGLLEGSCKYRRHNYRVAGVRVSVYYDAAMRHLAQWWEGEDIDPDSGLHHVVKAMCCLMVVRDSMLTDNIVDDRPPSTMPKGWMADMNKAAEGVLDRFTNPLPPYVKGDEK